MEIGWKKKIQMLKWQDVKVNWGEAKKNLWADLVMLTKVINVGKMLVVVLGMMAWTSRVLTWVAVAHQMRIPSTEPTELAFMRATQKLKISVMVQENELDNSEDWQENAKVLAKIGGLREWPGERKGWKHH